MVARDGTAVMCMFAMGGKEYKMIDRVGWIHTLDNPMPVTLIPHIEKPKLTKEELVRIMSGYNTGIYNHCTEYGLPVELGLLNACVTPTGYLAIPMYDQCGSIVGIRYRAGTGSKWSEGGSRSGLFMARHIGPLKEPMVICEGPTDCAAMLSMRISAIGRPDCQSCVDMLCKYVRMRGVKHVVILADKDQKEDGRTPGFDGAMKLAAELKKVCRVAVALPRCGNDARQWIKHDDEATIRKWLNGAINL